MRTILLALALTFCLTAAEDTPVQTTQKLFDAMHAHDAATVTALFAPGATLGSIDEAGKLTLTPAEKFIERVGTSKSSWLERMWSPTVLEKGTIALVWAEYDFHLDGKFSHCGIDSVQLVKTPDGWKIASLTYTHVTSACKPSPLGPPAK